MEYTTLSLKDVLARSTFTSTLKLLNVSTATIHVLNVQVDLIETAQDAKISLP